MTCVLSGFGGLLQVCFPSPSERCRSEIGIFFFRAADGLDGSMGVFVPLVPLQHLAAVGDTTAVTYLCLVVRANAGCDALTSTSNGCIRAGLRQHSLVMTRETAPTTARTR